MQRSQYLCKRVAIWQCYKYAVDGKNPTNRHMIGLVARVIVQALMQRQFCASINL